MTEEKEGTPVKSEEYSNGRSWYRHVIGTAVIAGSFGTFYIVAMGQCDPTWEKTVFMIVGALITLVTQVVGWYYGSSEGSQRKNELFRLRK